MFLKFPSDIVEHCKFTYASSTNDMTSREDRVYAWNLFAGNRIKPGQFPPLRTLLQRNLELQRDDPHFHRP